MLPKRNENIPKFDAYLNDEQVYISLKNFWIDLFFDILDEKGLEKSDWIAPFYSTRYANGESFMDGNPIFSALSIDNRIIRLIHENLDEVESHWEEMNEEKDELVIVCGLPSKSADAVANLIRNWL